MVSLPNGKVSTNIVIQGQNTIALSAVEELQGTSLLDLLSITKFNFNHF